ncbi:LOB domain-containing protein 4 [Setaria viridis]|uniref:LOB domain-containing protein 4 n=1 Tax=Setaria viridis TaxID=4556 RepID=UPI003B3A6F4D
MLMQDLAKSCEVMGVPFLVVYMQSLPVHERGKAADTMAAEARWRVQDPVYGCAGIVGRLQGEIKAAQCELARTRAQIAMHAAAAARPQPVVDARLSAPAQAAPPPQEQQQGDALVMQLDPFQGLDALLIDDYRAVVDLVDDEMNTD